MEPTDFAALTAPFAPEFIKERAGAGGRMFSYIGVRTIMDRMDRVLGPGSWSTEYRDWGEQGIVCRIGIRIQGGGGKEPVRIEWVYKENLGVRSDIEGEKGGITAAFRRAAQNEWGIGRELYQEPTEDEAPPPPPEETISLHDAHRRLAWDKADTKLIIGDESFSKYFGSKDDITLFEYSLLQLGDAFVKRVEKTRTRAQLRDFLAEKNCSFILELGREFLEAQT